jgi:hypothetical protein
VQVCPGEQGGIGRVDAGAYRAARLATSCECVSLVRTPSLSSMGQTWVLSDSRRTGAENSSRS